MNLRTGDRVTPRFARGRDGHWPCCSGVHAPYVHCYSLRSLAPLHVRDVNAMTSDVVVLPLN